MSNLIQTTLGELVSKEKKSIISGPFGSNIGKIFFRTEGIPVIRGNNLSTGGEKFKDDGFVFVSREKADELNCYAIKNDLIFTAVGTIGQVGIIDEKLKFDEYVISNKQLRVRFDNSKITPLFAYYWFSSYWIQKLILQRNVGSTVPLINLSVLKGLPISLPRSINVQNKIVEFLENISLKIELNNKINAELEAMAKTLYDYWFVQFDFPDTNGKPYKSSGGKMIYNEELKREIPEGWEVEKIGNVTDVKAGGDKPKDFSVNKSETHSIPIYSNGITNEGLYGFTNKAKITKQSLTVSARGTIGYCVLRNKPFVPIIRLIVITPKNPYEIKYFYEFIKNLEFENSGSVQQQLTVPQISSLNIVLPPPEILKMYDLLTSSGIEKIEINKLENQELASLRDWLLPMLMNGQVSVGEVEEQLGMFAEPSDEYKKS